MQSYTLRRKNMTIKSNEDKINELKTSLSRLRDDMAQVRNELNNFKTAVTQDMTKLIKMKQK